MFWSVAFAAAAGVVMARALRHRTVAFISLAVGLGIIEAFFNPPLALTFMALAVLSFIFYVTSTAAWKGAFSPASEESSSEETTKRGITPRLF
ncbi:MAG: hypothetical protein WA510_22815 [Acidobacteriaceae bacterium]